MSRWWVMYQFDLCALIGLVAVWLSGFLAGRWAHSPTAPVAWSQVEVPQEASCWASHDEMSTIVCSFEAME